MATQTAEITQLRQRVESVKLARIRNLKRLEERREVERERERTVLRPRMVGGASQSGSVSAGGSGAWEAAVQTGEGVGVDGGDQAEGSAVPGRTNPAAVVVAAAPEPIRVIKRKKKVRQAEIS